MCNYDFDWQIDEYMVYCQSKQLRPKTMNSYEQALRLFQRWCKDSMQIDSVDKVTESVIRRYINDLQERGKYSFYCNDKTKQINFPERRRDYRADISEITINNYIRNLRAFFNWLDRDYILQKNPMKRVQQLKTNRKAKEYLTDDEVKKLTACLDKSYFSEHRDFAMITLMLDSGMRLGECSSLLITDIQLEKKTAIMRADITKGRKDRSVFFSPRTELVLRRWLQFKDRYCESDYLFPVKTGNHINSINFEANFRKYIKRAGIKKEVSPHCLRNNFAKRCLMNGMSVIVFSERCRLRNVEYYSENLEVCTRDELPTVIARFWKEFPNCLDEKQVENLYNKLLPLAKQDTLRKNKHIEDIKDRLNSEELCPKCGNQLVLRTARSGPNAGKQFWGCSNYPRCTYLRNL